MKNTLKIMALLGLCLAISACGRGKPDTGAADNSSFQYEDSEMETEEGWELEVNRVGINEELMEPMTDSRDLDRGAISDRAREKLLSEQHVTGFPELGGLPRPESCVAGMSVKQSAPYVYIYRVAEGDDAFDETEMLSSVLAWLSVVEDSGFRVMTMESSAYIYEGSREVAHFVLSGTTESGYLLYLQIVA